MANEQTTETITNEQPSESAEVVDLKHGIPQELEAWAEQELGKDNPEKITQNQYNAFLMDIHDRYIPSMELKDNRGHYNNEKAMYNIYRVYVYMCYKYDKHIDINGFSIISGVDHSTLDSWLVDRKASTWKTELVKKLKHLDVETAKNMLLSNNHNPVGVMGYGNNFLGWSDKRIIHQTESAPQSLASIADSLGVALPGN